MSRMRSRSSRSASQRRCTSSRARRSRIATTRQRLSPRSWTSARRRSARCSGFVTRIWDSLTSPNIMTLDPRWQRAARHAARLRPRRPSRRTGAGNEREGPRVRRRQRGVRRSAAARWLASIPRTRDIDHEAAQPRQPAPLSKRRRPDKEQQLEIELYAGLLERCGPAPPPTARRSSTGFAAGTDQPMGDHGLHDWWYGCLERAGSSRPERPAASGCTRRGTPPVSASSTRPEPESGAEAARARLDLDDRRHLRRLGHRPAGGHDAGRSGGRVNHSPALSEKPCK